MGKFSNIIKKASAKYRKSITCDDIIAKYPGGITVNGAYTFANPKNGEVLNCWTFAEDNSKYYAPTQFGPRRIMEAMLENYEMERLDEELAAEPVKIRIWKEKMANGHIITMAEEVDP